MKKSILNIGKALNKAELKAIHGGISTTSGGNRRGPGEGCEPGWCQAGYTCDVSQPDFVAFEPGTCIAIGSGGRGSICPDMPGQNCNFVLE